MTIHIDNMEASVRENNPFLDSFYIKFDKFLKEECMEIPNLVQVAVGVSACIYDENEVLVLVNLIIKGERK